MIIYFYNLFVYLLKKPIIFLRFIEEHHCYLLSDYNPQYVLEIYEKHNFLFLFIGIVCHSIYF